MKAQVIPVRTGRKIKITNIRPSLYRKIDELEGKLMAIRVIHHQNVAKIVVRTA